MRITTAHLLAAVRQFVGLTVTCAAAYGAVTAVQMPLELSPDGRWLGVMWTVIAAVFVFHTSTRRREASATSRLAATLLSCAVCLCYLLLGPVTWWSLSVIVAVVASLPLLIGRSQDAVTAGITAVVVLAAAHISAPDPGWEQAALRMLDTALGVAVGLTVGVVASRVPASTRARRR